MEQVVYDGVAITDEFDVVGVTRPLPTPTPVYQYVNGGDRNAVRGVELAPPCLTFRIVARELSDSARRQAARRLAQLLIRDRPVDVSFGSDDGLRYRAVPEGALDLREYVRSGCMDVRLLCEEAAMRGATGKAAASSSATIDVGGTYRTALKVTAASAVRDPSSYLWGVRVDGGDHAHVELPTGSATALSIDSDGGLVTVDGAAGQITLDSDWLVVEPGSHTVARDAGTGAFEVEWEERWL